MKNTLLFIPKLIFVLCASFLLIIGNVYSQLDEKNQLIFDDDPNPEVVS